MDQQFQQYEQFFKNLFEKVKGAILPKADPKIRWRIVVFCLFIFLSVGIPLFFTVRDYFGYFIAGPEYVEALLYPFIVVTVPFFGAIITLTGKKFGWYLLATWLIKRAFGSLSTLLMSYSWSHSVESELIDRIDEITGFSLEMLIGSAFLFGGMSIYMHTKGFREVYSIRKYNRFIPLILASLWMFLEYALSQI